MLVTEQLLFLVLGYVATVAVEIPVLLYGLGARHKFRDKLNAGFLLTAFSYPFVILLFPLLIMAPLGRGPYLLIAESFAIVAEVLIFRFVVNQRLAGRLDRDAAVIVIANLLSFAAGSAFLSDGILRLVKNLVY